MAERDRRDVTVFHILIPVRVPAPGDFAGAWVGGGIPLESSNPEPYLTAAWAQLADFVDEARMLGLDTRGRAVAAEPLQAILDALARTPVAEVGLASSPNPVARRLRIDLAARLRRRVTLPVSEITARPALTT